MRVGDLRIDPVIDGTGRFSPTKSFRGTTDEQWAVHRDLLDADGLLGFAMGGFLIRGNGHVALVDLGMGARRGWGSSAVRSFRWPSTGRNPADVTDVVFTHLHFDHIGWASTDEGQPVFPNATYRCAPADWDHFMGDDPDGEVSARWDRYGSGSRSGTAPGSSCPVSTPWLPPVTPRAAPWSY